MALPVVSIQREDVDIDAFEEFATRNERRLRIALIATYGPQDGQIAALDALSWAWEHWHDVQAMGNPVGYLYRVGQSSVRRRRLKFWNLALAGDCLHATYWTGRRKSFLSSFRLCTIRCWSDRRHCGRS